MTYSPIEPEDLQPGSSISDQIDDLGANHDECYKVATHIASSAALSWKSTTGTSAMTDVGWIWMYGNNDNQPVYMRFRAAISATGTCKLRLYSGSDYTETDVTATTSTWFETSVTPTGSSPRKLTVYLASDAGDTAIWIEVDSIYIYTLGAAPAAPALASGFVKWDTAANTTNESLPSERMSRLQQGPYQIARDRQVTLLSFVHDATISRADFKVTGTSYQPLYWGQFRGDGGPGRKYRVVTYNVETGTGDPTLRITVGDSVFEHAGPGMVTSVLSGVSDVTVPVLVEGKHADGSGVVALATLQIMREPA